MARILRISKGMITKYELCEISGYPEITSHIVDISKVVLIRLQEAKSYSFTLTLDNDECINVSKACDDNDGHVVYQAICRLRDKLVSEISHSKAGYLSTIGNSASGS